METNRERAERAWVNIINRYLRISPENPVRGPERQAIISEIERAMDDAVDDARHRVRYASADVSPVFRDGRDMYGNDV